MTDSTADPDSDADAPTLAMESLREARKSLNAAQEAERLSMEIWVAASEIEDPKAIERAKIELDRAGRGITEAFRVMGIAQSTFDRSIQDVQAKAVADLMWQAEAGAERRAIATGELMQAANSQATSLKRATWALAFATIVLAIATVVLIFVTASV